jgi:hypothetical protein
MRIVRGRTLRRIIPLLALIVDCSLALTVAQFALPFGVVVEVGDAGANGSPSSLGSFFIIDPSSGKSGNPSSAGKTCITTTNHNQQNATQRDRHDHAPESPKTPIVNKSSVRFGPDADPAGGVVLGTTSGPSHSKRTPGIRPASSPIRSLMLSRLRRSTALWDSRRRRRFSERWASGSRCLVVDVDDGAEAAGLERPLTCGAGREDAIWCAVMPPMDILLSVSTSVGDMPMLGVLARLTEG